MAGWDIAILPGWPELHRAGLNHFELVGVCDPVSENAESLAQQAKEHFGKRPAAVSNLEELAALGIEAVDITTTPRHHHTIAIEALQRGWHVMVEKPMGLTVRTCNLMRRAAEQSDRILSVAENFRRDPINRLAKALLQAGAIGTPRLLLHPRGGIPTRIKTSLVNSFNGSQFTLTGLSRMIPPSCGLLLSVFCLTYFRWSISHQVPSIRFYCNIVSLICLIGKIFRQQKEPLELLPVQVVGILKRYAVISDYNYTPGQKSNGGNTDYVFVSAY